MNFVSGMSQGHISNNIINSPISNNVSKIPYHTEITQKLFNEV